MHSVREIRPGRVKRLRAWVDLFHFTCHSIFHIHEVDVSPTSYMLLVRSQFFFVQAEQIIRPLFPNGGIKIKQHPVGR